MNEAKPTQIDSLLVLGRGIDESGLLSPTGFDRAEKAVCLAQTLMPKIVVFSGGNSWVQEVHGIQPPSEGQAMLDHAISFADGSLPAESTFLAETTSTSTVANMINSKHLLGLQPGSRLGILSDELHFSRGRIHFLAKLVFPEVDVEAYQIKNKNVPGAESEERMTNVATRFFMAGVRPGNDRGIMRRQYQLEYINSMLRRIIGHKGDNTVSLTSTTTQ